MRPGRAQVKCPQCRRLTSKVVDSFGQETLENIHEQEIVRRRMCAACGFRFFTSERVTNIKAQALANSYKRLCRGESVSESSA